MRTYYYLYYHHVSPCVPNVEYAVHYSNCASPILELAASTASPLSPLSAVSDSHIDNGGVRLVQYPCGELTYAPEWSPVEG
ncbi:hypothetical protein DL769_006562 [Monosporascus sp. CRB-8-3]|nr:hypothetical protein DL769_006562 [Monosporascus sp. CRB-8-3]